MGAFRQDFVETVRAQSDIVRLVSDYVTLKPAGSRMKGLCPFHQEKTPSFSVDPERQLFYCFGCQTGGDIFKFAMLYEKLEFPEALPFIADRFGIPLPAPDPQAARRQSALERAVAVNLLAEAFFRRQLADEAGQACRAYLERRGFGGDTAESLRLGFAPDAWEALGAHLRAKGVSPQELIDFGLSLARKQGGGQYDRFRNRLIFPIRDVMGRVVAFGGRTLGDDPAKYINSPETPAYTKGEHLYGLDLAKEPIRREGFAVVVEGYADAAAVRQAGFDNVVASLGTAFTAQQARLLSRFSRRLTFSYDGDGAGADATRRSLDMLLEQGFEVRIVQLPSGMDPDDLIKAEGSARYRQLLAEAPGYLDFLILREAETHRLARIEDKVQAVNAVLPHIAKLTNTIERVAWADRLADALQIEKGLVLEELKAALKTARPRIRTPVASDVQPVPVEAALIRLLLRSEAYRQQLVEQYVAADFEGCAVRSIVSVIARRVETEQPVDYPHVLEALEDETDRRLLARIAFRDDPDEDQTLDDCLCVLRKKRMEREAHERIRQISKWDQQHQADAEETPGASDEDLNRRLREIQELAKKREALL